ncbi:DAD family-domain-containing protein [Lasiosphaeria miniovina]|uniref:Dolichyl-diphosphooligosaccharide--protein glycosyltransferase subunit OST2 n=1 Tax=Lasiosphaeria miniovina TaxID=1954250 RepID=A0AA40ECQ1_9PEZI|nr:DAD family-domain-containing protein [Lasiosphaeria miniovina]KAK0733477.1 DAD family-domain-containing protein [Lasiosphaeria miniovina]
MAPKNRNNRDVTPSAASTAQTSATSSGSAPQAAVSTSAKPAVNKSVSSSSSSKQDWNSVVVNLANSYRDSAPQRTKLIDAFMTFLVVAGALQFLYCVVAGNYPFNAFLSGFSATVGQFVLTASLRIQTTEANKSDFPSVSPERAFADFVFCSLVLHFFCVNFIN